MKTKNHKNLKVVLLVLSLLIVFFAFGTVMLFLDANHVLSKTESKKPVKTVANVEEDTNEEEQKEIEMDDFSVARVEAEGVVTDFSDIPEEVKTRDYMIAESNTRLLTKEDLTGLGKSELIIARNELYARYGYIFDKAELTTYFTAKPWYVPSVPAAQFSETQFNEFEKANMVLIMDDEKEKGFN